MNSSIIEKLDDFFNEREPKEKYMIYISIIIVIGIIYYLFNYKFLYNDLKQKQRDIVYTRKSYDIKAYEKKLLITKNKFNNLKREISSLEDNLKYIKNLISSIKSVNFFVNDDELFLFLKNVFSFSIKKSLFPSYSLSKKKHSALKEYKIVMKGQTSLKNFISFISTLRFIEKSHYIVTFDKVEFNVSKYRYGTVNDFNSTFSIWSYK